MSSSTATMTADTSRAMSDRLQLSRYTDVGEKRTDET